LLAFFAFFLVAIVSILPSIIHGLCNGHQLQLFECIESVKNDVKRKMTLSEHATGVLKSPTTIARDENSFSDFNQRLFFAMATTAGQVDGRKSPNTESRGEEMKRAGSREGPTFV